LESSQQSSRLEEFIANPERAVWKLSLPMMMGMALQTLYNITDLVFVGRLGGDAVAALTFNMPIVFCAIGITFGLGTGATSVIARFIGSNDKAQADNAAEHSILIGLGIGLLIVIGALAFKYQILAHLGASEEVLDLAVDYFEVTVPGFIFWILNVGFRSVMAGEGDTRTPMAFQGVGVILNIILDPVLIFWAGLGVAGAAWATVASQFVVLLAFLFYVFVRKGTYLRLSFRDFRPSLKIARDILHIGIPASAAILIMAVGGMCFNRIVSAFGSEAVAGFGVGGRVDSIYFLPTFAFASSQVTLVGMYLGAGRVDLIKRTMAYTMRVAQSMSIAFAVIFYVFAPQICAVFTDEPRIIEVAVSYIRVIVFAFPFVTIGVICGRVFQGLGHGIPGLILTSLRVILISVPLAVVLTRVFDYGLTAVWVAFPLSAAASSLLALGWIRRKLRLVENVEGAVAESAQ
jgi:putative MATE family efflux protein